MTSDVRSVIIKLQAVFMALGTAHRTISVAKLKKSWLADIKRVGATHAVFIKAYRLIRTVPPARTPDLHSPKMHMLLTDTVAWIQQNNCTLARESEQAAESQHYDYLMFSKRYSADRVGPEIPTTNVIPKSVPMPQRFEHEVEGPITGTRSGSIRKAHKKGTQLPQPHQPERPVIVGNLVQSRKKTLRSVVSYNIKNLPSSSLCQQRLMQLHEFAQSQKAQPPPKIFQSDGRSGSTLACFVKQWKSNDSV